MAGDQSNGKSDAIRWRDIERMALILGIIVSGLFYFVRIDARIGAVDAKVSQVIRDRRANIRLHAAIESPPVCGKCMGSIRFDATTASTSNGFLGRAEASEKMP